MAAVVSNATEAIESSGEYKSSFRLGSEVRAAVEAVAQGLEEGESGLKSCTISALVVGDAGAKASETLAQHHREIEIIADIDECFNVMGDLLAAGFTHAQVFATFRFKLDSVKRFALERYCDLIGLKCDADNPPQTSHGAFSWWAKQQHQRRAHARAVFQALRSTSAGTAHAAVLHIVYGPTDPFFAALREDVQDALGREYGPLARYTDAVEVKRQELVLAEAGRVSSAYRSAAERTDGDGIITQMLAHAAEREEMHRLAVNNRTQPTAQVFDLERARSRREWADRMISSGDALRAATDERLGKSVREAFISRVRVDANRMLSEASRAFDNVWRSL